MLARNQLLCMACAFEKINTFNRQMRFGINAEQKCLKMAQTTDSNAEHGICSAFLSMQMKNHFQKYCLC
jgi:hypothetical protein